MGSDLNQPWVREQYLSEQVRKLDAENAELRAHVARYEAPGSALLYVECGDHDVACVSVDGPCICAEGRAYREQHARCVAVISALKATHNEACIAYEAAAGRRRCRAHGCDGDVIEYGFELALAALTGEAEP